MKIILWYISATTMVGQQGEFKLATNKYADFETVYVPTEMLLMLPRWYWVAMTTSWNITEPATYDVEVNVADMSNLSRNTMPDFKARLHVDTGRCQ